MFFTTLILQDYPQLRVTSFHNSLNSLQDACWILSDLYIPTCVAKMFQFEVFTFPEKALNLCIFTHVPVSHLKLQVKFFENLFSTMGKGWRKLWFALSKFNQKTWGWPGTLVYSHFVWSVIFLNVMALHVCK